LTLWIDQLKSKAKNWLKKRLDFPFENKIETMDRLAKIHGQKIVETKVSFSFEKEIETMARLAKI